jgi:O-glycosyl hydrolase
MFCKPRMVWLLGAVVLGVGLSGALEAQEAIVLPQAKPVAQGVAQRFEFVSDGPVGPGWSRPDAVARVYVEESLPELFRRTVQLDGDVPQGGRLTWIFTGPHAGVTVELTNSKVRVLERFYDSAGLDGAGNFPEKTVRDDEREYVGHARTLTVVVDAYLSVRVLLNGEVMLTEPLVFDLTRHQLMFSGLRNEHAVLAGAVLAEKPEDATITVAAGKLHQSMIGFGGSPSVPAYARLSDEGKRMYWDLLRRYNLLIDREYPMGTQLKQDLSNVEDLRDATPHYYGDNFPNGEVSDFDYSRRTRELGGSVLYEMWALPSWAVESYTPEGKPAVDAWGKPVKKAAKPDVYARIVVEFCKRAKERSGAAPEIVGVQNEVEQAPEIFAAMTMTLRKALDAAGFEKTKIQMADAPYLWMAVGRVEDAKKFPEEWKTIDYTAAHQYDFQEFFANPDLYDERLRAMHEASAGKEFLATEICLNDAKLQEASYRMALQVGQLYQKDLVELDAEMLLYCWLILDVEQPSFGASRSLLVADRSRGNVPVASSFQLRVMGAFSRHVLKGMRRVEATSGDADLLTAAFTDGAKSSMVVVNRGTEAKKLRVDWNGVKWTRMERTSFYSENVGAAAPSEIVVAPGEIVTLSNFSLSDGVVAK